MLNNRLILIFLFNVDYKNLHYQVVEYKINQSAILIQNLYRIPVKDYFLLHAEQFPAASQQVLFAQCPEQPP